MQTTQLHRILHFKTSIKLVSLGLLIITADVLFYRQPAGWTWGLFGFLVLYAAYIHNQKQITQHRNSVVALSAAAGLIAVLIIRPGGLAMAMYVVTIFSLALLIRNPDLQDIRRMITGTPIRMLLSIGRLFFDSVLFARIRKRRHKMSGRSMSFMERWLMPLVLSGVFILLFAEANPIITRFLSVIDWEWIARLFSLPRMLFWVYVAAPCWAVIRPHMRILNRTAASEGSSRTSSLTGLLFNENSVFMALVLFNGLFLIQNMLDVTFLWSGAALPSGMSRAEYAHQGAYPLVATALLAAVFVLIALKPGSATERLPRIRRLVYAWVGQNVFLILSSITRLNGYIQEFSLTYLRVAALVWMGLVALGLLLIVARIYFRKSNLWLINANFGVLYITLYLCSFIGFGGIIADYNVQHCSEMGGAGERLDIRYLEQDVGVEALPALIRYNVEHPAQASEAIRNLQMQVTHSLQDWRQWTVQMYRLGAYTAQD